MSGTKGRPYHDVRTTVNGIVWIARSGAPWRDLPERYGKWNTVYKCFAKWQEQGIFERVFHELRLDADLQDISMDSTSCKAHQHSTGAKKRSNTSVNEHIGISRGGKNTKIHATVDALGYSLHVQLTDGNVHDAAVAVELLEKTLVKRSIIMADKAYRGKSIRDAIESLACTPCVPLQSNDKEKWEVDWWQYKERSNVECFFKN